MVAATKAMRRASHSDDRALVDLPHPARTNPACMILFAAIRTVPLGGRRHDERRPEKYPQPRWRKHFYAQNSAQHVL